MKKYFTFFLLLIILLSCRTTNTKKELSLIPSEPPPIKKQTVDTEDAEVKKIINKANELFLLGKKELNDGHLEKARNYFDQCIDVFLNSAFSISEDNTLRSAFEDIVNKINSIEMDAISEGDGFTEIGFERATIDDLESIVTFPPEKTEAQKIIEKIQNEMKVSRYDVPIEINDAVLYFLNYYQSNGKREQFEAALKRSGKYVEMMKEIFKEEGIPQDIIYLAIVESAFKTRALSRARAKGIWQFIRSTGRRYGLSENWWLDEKYDPVKATRAAARYLKDLYNMFGDWYLALASYHAGEGRIEKAIKKTGGSNFWDIAKTKYIKRETKNYVPAFLAALLIAKNQKDYGFNIIPDEPLKWDEVEISSPADLRIIAECSGSTIEEIKNLNPELLRLTTPRHASLYKIKIPYGKKEEFLAKFNSIPEERRVFWRYHFVKNGDTLYSISRRYGVNVSILKEVNSLKSNLIRVGMRLQIPSSYSTGRNYTKKVTKIIYKIRSGDTLYQIAQNYNTSVSKIKRWNNLKDDILYPGQKLIIYHNE
ncbi:MAG: LysM peptidoglycan-binding domain-containing protein [Acidobacteriota bacterium]